VQQPSRIDSLKKLIAASPKDPRPRFAIAVEYEKMGRWEAVVKELTEYLKLTDDQGNAWGRLAHALRELGRDEDARTAYERGAAEAYRHGHPSMAMEFEDILHDLT
jgi:predicted Zn-dependent protease